MPKRALEREMVGLATYWFCSFAAFLMACFGFWNILQDRPHSILFGCFGAAAAFYVSGLLVRSMAQMAARNA